MKISKAIETLQEIYKEHGDMDLALDISRSTWLYCIGIELKEFYNGRLKVVIAR